MNKKGAVLHWIILGVIAAVGVFLLSSNVLSISTQKKGEWQTNFLYDTFFPAETDLLSLDQEARFFLQEKSLQLAANGGFKEESACGSYKGKPLWYMEGKWCLEDVKKNVEDGLKEKFPGISEVKFDGNSVSGKIGTKTITASDKYKQEYTYDYSFKVDIGYNIGEYVILEQEARRLVDLCKDDPELEACLERHTLRITKCGDITSRKVDFCVESLEKSVLKGNLVKYLFAIEFS